MSTICIIIYLHLLFAKISAVVSLVLYLFFENRMPWMQLGSCRQLMTIVTSLVLSIQAHADFTEVVVQRKLDLSFHCFSTCHLVCKFPNVCLPPIIKGPGAKIFRQMPETSQISNNRFKTGVSTDYKCRRKLRRFCISHRFHGDIVNRDWWRWDQLGLKSDFLNASAVSEQFVTF